jgi:N-acetylglucosaminyl-diphospho-decaprenol L-rhamnosyltransferase
MINENRIPIIIVSYRNPGDVAECLSALSRVTAEPKFDVFICENGGSAAFDALIASLSAANGPCGEEPAATYAHLLIPQFVRVQHLRIRNSDTRIALGEAIANLGYAGAINSWLRALRTLPAWRGVWVLNPDTQPEPLALAELVAASAAQRKGMVGSRITYPEQPEIVATRGLKWRRVLASTKAIGRNEPVSVEPDPEQIGAWLSAPSGVSIYVTRQCLDYIGLMDEEYFLYFEDLDWGYRAKKTCGIGYAHRSIVPHKGGTTIGSGRTRSTTSAFSVYLDFRNRINFVRKCHHSWITWTVLVLSVRSIEYGIVGAFVNMHIALRGLKAGLAGETGRPDRLFEFIGDRPGIRSTPKGLAGGRQRFVCGGALKRKIKIAISMAFHLQTEANHLLCRAIGRSPPQRLVILYYHGVPANLRSNFSRQLDIISSRVSVVPADYYDAAASAGRIVALTFDDAFSSVLENAIPELRARRMPGTIFIPVGSMGGRPGWEIEPGYGHGEEVVATADALRAQMSDLVRYGAHSLTHPYLTRIPRDEAREEITECRKQMYGIFGVNVDAFAFPYGDHDEEINKLCREAGYKWVFTNVPRVANPASDEPVRGRVLVNADDGPLEFYLKMSGAYAWMAYASTIKRWLKQLPHRIRGLLLHR